MKTNVDLGVAILCNNVRSQITRFAVFCKIRERLHLTH